MKIQHLIWVGICALAAGCTASDRTAETLAKAGYTEIKTGGYAVMACSDSDTFHTKFTAKNPAGVKVSGVVCCGWIKDCTVRF